MISISIKKLCYILCGVSLISACTGTDKQALPILGNRETIEKKINGKTIVDTVYQTIPPFRFLNQDSVVVTEKDFNGKIYVADFFFTSCTSICPVMHRNMMKVYDEFKGNNQVKILSHTIDSKYDTPSVLKRYATKLGVEKTQWEFVHGSRDFIYGVAANSYLVSIGEDNKSKDGFIHQGWFVLVDKEKRLRGAYDGTKEEQVEQLIKDIRVLLHEDK